MNTAHPTTSNNTDAPNPPAAPEHGDPMNYEPIEEHHNKRATFHPQTRDDGTPCVQLAGIQIYTYLHQRQLCISVHYDTAEDFLLDENDAVPTEISLSGIVVYDSHKNTNPEEQEQP